MKMINIHEAKTHLSRLLNDVAAGEEVVIARAGRPIARLIAYRPESGLRRLGAWKGKVRVSRDFDDFGPDLEEMFHGGRQ